MGPFVFTFYSFVSLVNIYYFTRISRFYNPEKAEHAIKGRLREALYSYIVPIIFLLTWK